MEQGRGRIEFEDGSNATLSALSCHYTFIIEEENKGEGDSQFNNNKHPN